MRQLTDFQLSIPMSITDINEPAELRHCCL